MKKFLDAVYSFIEALGQARAATALTRAGKIDLAKQLYK